MKRYNKIIVKALILITIISLLSISHIANIQISAVEDHNTIDIDEDELEEKTE